MPPISYLEQTGGGSRLPRDPFAMPPETVPVSRSYDDVAPAPAITPEQARKIQGLLQAEQHQAMYQQALRDAARPAMFMFNKAGNVTGAVDSNKRMGYGALAAMLGADADRYSENNRSDMFQQEMQQRNELARLPYQQMTMADQQMGDFRDRELKERSRLAEMPYEKMTPYEQGMIENDRIRFQNSGNDPFMQAIGNMPELLNDPEYKSKLDERILGSQARSPEQLKEIMGERVLDNEIQGILSEEFPEGMKKIEDYSHASQVTAEGLVEQVLDGVRSYMSALKAAEGWDRQSPKGAKSAVKALESLHSKASAEKALKEQRSDYYTTEQGQYGIPSFMTGGQ